MALEEKLEVALRATDEFTQRYMAREALSNVLNQGDAARQKLPGMLERCFGEDSSFYIADEAAGMVATLADSIGTKEVRDALTNCVASTGMAVPMAHALCRVLERDGSGGFNEIALLLSRMGSFNPAVVENVVHTLVKLLNRKPWRFHMHSRFLCFLVLVPSNRSLLRLNAFTSLAKIPAFDAEGNMRASFIVNSLLRWCSNYLPSGQEDEWEQLAAMEASISDAVIGMCAQLEETKRREFTEKLSAMLVSNAFFAFECGREPSDEVSLLYTLITADLQGDLVRHISSLSHMLCYSISTPTKAILLKILHAVCSTDQANGVLLCATLYPLSIAATTPTPSIHKSAKQLLRKNIMRAIPWATEPNEDKEKGSINECLTGTAALFDGEVVALLRSFWQQDHATWKRMGWEGHCTTGINEKSQKRVSSECSLRIRDCSFAANMLLPQAPINVEIARAAFDHAVLDYESLAATFLPLLLESVHAHIARKSSGLYKVVALLASVCRSRNAVRPAMQAIGSFAGKGNAAKVQAFALRTLCSAWERQPGLLWERLRAGIGMAANNMGNSLIKLISAESTKRVCLLHPEKGAELIHEIQDFILSFQKNTAVAARGLECVTCLCRAKVLDYCKAMAYIQQKLSESANQPFQQSQLGRAWVEMMEEGADHARRFNSSAADSKEESGESIWRKRVLTQTIPARLWHLAKFGDKGVRISAVHALSSFRSDMEGYPHLSEITGLFFSTSEEIDFVRAIENLLKRVVKEEEENLPRAKKQSASGVTSLRADSQRAYRVLHLLPRSLLRTDISDSVSLTCLGVVGKSLPELERSLREKSMKIECSGFTSLSMMFSTLHTFFSQWMDLLRGEEEQQDDQHRLSAAHLQNFQRGRHGDSLVNSSLLLSAYAQLIGFQGDTWSAGEVRRAVESILGNLEALESIDEECEPAVLALAVAAYFLHISDTDVQERVEGFLLNSGTSREDERTFNIHLGFRTCLQALAIYCPSRSRKKLMPHVLRCIGEWAPFPPALKELLNSRFQGAEESHPLHPPPFESDDDRQVSSGLELERACLRALGYAAASGGFHGDNAEICGEIAHWFSSLVSSGNLHDAKLQTLFSIMPEIITSALREGYLDGRVAESILSSLANVEDGTGVEQVTSYGACMGRLIHAIPSNGFSLSFDVVDESLRKFASLTSSQNLNSRIAGSYGLCNSLGGRIDMTGWARFEHSMEARTSDEAVSGPLALAKNTEHRFRWCAKLLEEGARNEKLVQGRAKRAWAAALACSAIKDMTRSKDSGANNALRAHALESLPKHGVIRPLCEALTESEGLSNRVRAASLRLVTTLSVLPLAPWHVIASHSLKSGHGERQDAAASLTFVHATQNSGLSTLAAELCEHWRYDDLPQSTRYSILASLHKGAQALPADYPSQLCSYVALSETPNRSIEERGKAIEAVARLSGATGKEGFKQSLITILDRCLSSSAGFRLPSCPCEEGFDDVAAAKPAQLYSALVRGIGELPLADIRKLLLLNHDGNVRRAYLLTQAAKHGMVGSEELVRLRTWCSHSLARDDSLAVACALVASLIMTNPSQSAKEEWLLESTREIGRSPAPTNATAFLATLAKGLGSSWDAQELDLAVQSGRGAEAALDALQALPGRLLAALRLHSFSRHSFASAWVEAALDAAEAVGRDRCPPQLCLAINACRGSLPMAHMWRYATVMEWAAGVQNSLHEAPKSNE